MARFGPVGAVTIALFSLCCAGCGNGSHAGGGGSGGTDAGVTRLHLTVAVVPQSIQAKRVYANGKRIGDVTSVEAVKVPGLVGDVVQQVPGSRLDLSLDGAHGLRRDTPFEICGDSVFAVPSPRDRGRALTNDGHSMAEVRHAAGGPVSHVTLGDDSRLKSLVGAELSVGGKRVGRAVLGKPTLVQQVPLPPVHKRLVELVFDPPLALDYHFTLAGHAPSVRIRPAPPNCTIANGATLYPGDYAVAR